MRLLKTMRNTVITSRHFENKVTTARRKKNNNDNDKTNNKRTTKSNGVSKKSRTQTIVMRCHNNGQRTKR